MVVAGELWKVAREQCRLANNSEKMGIEYVLQECQELIEEYKKNSHRAGYKDITQEPWPEDEVEGEEDNPPRPKIPRQVRFMDDEEGTGPLGETERGLPPQMWFRVPNPRLNRPMKMKKTRQ